MKKCLSNIMLNTMLVLTQEIIQWDVNHFIIVKHNLTYLWFFGKYPFFGRNCYYPLKKSENLQKRLFFLCLNLCFPLNLLDFLGYGPFLFKVWKNYQIPPDRKMLFLGNFLCNAISFEDFQSSWMSGNSFTKKRVICTKKS